MDTMILIDIIVVVVIVVVGVEIVIAVEIVIGWPVNSWTPDLPLQTWFSSRRKNPGVCYPPPLLGRFFE